jgi:thioredoxin 1
VSKANRFIIVALVAAAAAVFVWIKAAGPRSPQRTSAAPVVEPVVGKDVEEKGVLDRSEPRPRLVDVGSNKCIPCRLMAPILATLKEDYGGVLAIDVIDIRDDRTAAQRYGIRVIPTQIFYDASGTERFRHEGFMSKEAILAKWHELGVELVPPEGEHGGR